MTPPAVVINLNVIEKSLLGLSLIFESYLINELVFNVWKNDYATALT